MNTIFLLFWLIFQLVKAEYYVKGFDCRTANYVQNISLTHNKPVEFIPVNSTPATVQIIQRVHSSQVTVKELTITKTELVQQCAMYANDVLNWYNELVTSFMVGENLKLTRNEMEDFHDTSQLNLGSEYGADRAITVQVTEGTNFFRLVPIGKIIHSDYYKDGRPRCSGEKYRDRYGNDHPYALVVTVYKVTVHTRNSYVINTKVPVDRDDGSCEISEAEKSSFCYNQISGTNHWITKEQQGTYENCPFLPTRKDLIQGEILSDVFGHRVFLSNHQKIVFTLGDTVELCGCMETVQTNLENIYLRKTPPCSVLPTSVLPPPALNLEYNTNIKLDWLQFKTHNDTNFIYENLLTDIQKTQYQELNNFFTLAGKNRDLTLFKINHPFFGKIRGEVLSVLKCQEKMYQVIESPDYCTVNIQVTSENETLYIEHRSRLLTESSQPVDCEFEGDLFGAEDAHGNSLTLFQEDSVGVFDKVTGYLNDTAFISLGVSLDNPMNYVSFDGSGIYDKSFLEMRKDYLFRGDQYAQMTRKVTKTFFHDSAIWNKKRNQELDFLDYISGETLLDAVFGHWFLRGVKEFLEKVSYLATSYFILQCFFFIGKGYRAFLRREKRSVLLVRDVEAATRHRMRLSDIDDSWESAFSEENYDSPPPPYNPYS